MSPPKSPRSSAWLKLAGALTVLVIAALAAVLAWPRQQVGRAMPDAGVEARSSPLNAAAVLAGIPWSDEPLDWTRPVATRPEAQGITEPGYVGSAACASCHPNIAESYSHHSMAKTGLRPLASLDTRWLNSIFDAGETVRHPSSGYSYRPFRQGSRYFIEEFVDSPGGMRLHSWVQPVTLSLSAGSYGMAFCFRNGERIYQVPIDYYPQVKRWGLDPGYSNQNHRFFRPITTFCISCHSEYPRYRPGFNDVLLDPLPGGVGCERCHGPGARHAESTLPADIVNPARLTSARQLDVCAQCHLGSRSVQRAHRGVFSCRPGEPLQTCRMNHLAEPPEPDDFPLLGHSERLVRSACFRGARGALTCTTCHEPHRSSQEQPAAWWDGKCVGCHAQRGCTARAEERAAAGNHCAGCHMRRATPSDVTLLAATDHWIRRRINPPGPLDLPIRHAPRPSTLLPYAALLGEKTTGDDLAAIEAVAYADGSVETSDGRLGDAVIQRLAQSVASLPEVPDAYLLLDTAYERLQQPQNQARAIAAILRFDPDHQDALFRYADILLAYAPPQLHPEGFRALDRLLTLAPDHAPGLELKGKYFLRNGRSEEARSLFERAVRGGPNFGAAHIGLAALALRKKDFVSALPHLLAARRITPADRWVLQKLVECYTALKDTARAREVKAVVEKLAGMPMPAEPPQSEWLPQGW